MNLQVLNDVFGFIAFGGDGAFKAVFGGFVQAGVAVVATGWISPFKPISPENTVS